MIGSEYIKLRSTLEFPVLPFYEVAGAGGRPEESFEDFGIDALGTTVEEVVELEGFAGAEGLCEFLGCLGTGLEEVWDFEFA